MKIKMELKVWVDGIQRIVCGVNDSTTCQDVVYALAHATGQTGRFTLLERWRNNERTLSPQERPLKVLSKWGEYSSDVQFILKRSTLTPKGSSNVHQALGHDASPQKCAPTSPPLSPIPSATCGKSHQSKEAIKKSLTFSGSHHSDNGPKETTTTTTTAPLDNKHENARNVRSPNHIPSDDSHEPIVVDHGGSIQSNEPLEGTELKEDEEQKNSEYDKKTEIKAPSNAEKSPAPHYNIHSPVSYHPAPQHHQPPPPSPQKNVGQKRQSSPATGMTQRPPGGPPPYPGTSPSVQKPYVGPISPPPYRSPPTDKIQKYPSKSPSSNTSTPSVVPTPSPNDTTHSPKGNMPKSRRNLYAQFGNHNVPYAETVDNDAAVTSSKLGESNKKSTNADVVKVVYDSRYRELVRMVNKQRDTINSQQAQMTQFDAEIVFWEEKQREYVRQNDLFELEVQKIECVRQEGEEEVIHLGQMRLEEDLELGHQQECTLHSELTLLRSKLANCETELLQCKNKIRILMDESTDERRLLSRKEDESRDRERNMLNEIENLQEELRSKIVEYESKVSTLSSEKLFNEVEHIENTIAKKKEEVADLVQEMKDVNLESLSISPGEEAKNAEGGSNRGITRKIMGSPRELENAVPTSKNPHGVWV